MLPLCILLFIYSSSLVASSPFSAFKILARTTEQKQKAERFNNSMTFPMESVKSELTQALAAAKKSQSPISGTNSPVTGSLQRPSLRDDSGATTPKEEETGGSSCATVVPSPLLSPEPIPTTDETNGAFSLLFD